MMYLKSDKPKYYNLLMIPVCLLINLRFNKSSHLQDWVHKIVFMNKR